MNTILIPVYNDWKSLNKLLLKINSTSVPHLKNNILVVDDFSSIKPRINFKKIKKIKKIELLKLEQNVGSQKAIAVGLNYLNSIKRNFNFITVMDGDGEDNPLEIKSMINLAIKNKKSVIVSCRKDRKENFVIKLLYKIHLFLTFFLTGNWISFGNFSCFHYSNLKKILRDESIWLAYSAAVKKNANIKRTYAIRLKRFFGKTQVSFLFLILHSLKIITVFLKRVLLFSLIYITIIYLLSLKFSLIFYLVIISINILLMIIKIKNKTKNNLQYSIKKIK